MGVRLRTSTIALGGRETWGRLNSESGPRHHDRLFLVSLAGSSSSQGYLHPPASFPASSLHGKIHL